MKNCMLVTLLVLVTAASSAAATGNGRLDQALAHRLSLHLSDMPPGWRVEPPSKSSSTYKGIKSFKKFETARAESSFSSNPQYATSQVGVLQSVTVAKRAFAEASSFFRTCASTIPGIGKVSVGAMSFPHFGDQTRAWNIQGEIKGFSVYFDIILVRIRRADVAYLFGGIGAGDSQREVNLVRRATSRA